MKKTMAFIHVIIPCYNVEKYLEQAVYSVLNQPGKEIDIVLVDDGSPGRTPQLCDALAAKEPCIHVIHKPNGGVSSARNAGIEYVLTQYADGLSGRYIAFLDADDCWESGFLSGETLELLDAGYDLVGFQSCTCDPGLVRTGKPGVLQEGSHCGGQDNVWIHSSQHFGAMFYSCAFLKRYDIRFQEGLRYSEDKIFSMTCHYLAGQIRLENRLMYLYRLSEGSAMGSRKFGIPYFLPIIDGYLKLDRQMRPFADENRGALKAGKNCVSHYIMDMIDEHYQQRGSKTEVDALLDSRPDYLDALNAVGDFADMTPNSRYQQYRSAPGKYIAKHRFLGVLMKIKRMIKQFL